MEPEEAPSRGPNSTGKLKALIDGAHTWKKASRSGPDANGKQESLDKAAINDRHRVATRHYVKIQNEKIQNPRNEIIQNEKI